MASKIEFEWNGDKISKKIEDLAIQGLELFGEVVLTEAKKRCPQDSGTLRRSGVVTFEEPNFEQIKEQAENGEVNVSKGKPDKEVIISFNTPYAHRQHEDTSLSHNIGEAKYLENALNSKKSDAKKIIAGHVKRMMK